MNLRGLRLLHLIVLTGSLSEAAARLNLSPSAASRLLSQLEDQLSLTLFSRSRRNLELTEDGAEFYQQIANTLTGIDEIATVARDIKTRKRNWLSVVTAPPLANALVVPAIAAMREAGHEFQCTVHVESRFAIESKVAARGYNLGVISLPVENAIIPLDIMPILKARLCVLMPENHALARHREITPAMLEGAPFVTLAPGQRWRSRLDEVMGGSGLRVDTAVETGSTIVTVEMVRMGLGVTLIDPVCAPALTTKGLVLRPLAGDHWITYASLHAKGPRSQLSEVFLDALSQHVEVQRAERPEIADLFYLI
ncbi:LysR family transcriptional regulator [Martelella lutilitoris]|uniref:LysR family transcriptional regulator n=1 Tax=Martelella lutilitoris TaxID=2583532 RepID=A0A5C4JQL3_9HYPH|nr:LysR family transcriptional regulator [Martelella lutilitoris]TNB47600.1 LysR family transcriptional regulator [Martelella lutilitoris]